MHKRKRARRSGRPARSGARTAAGRLSETVPIDRGTGEGQLHRQLLINGAADVTLAATPAGILLAHDLITPAQLRAGGRYAALRAVLFGLARPTVAADLVEPYDPRLRTDSYLRGVRNRFEELVAKITPEQKAALDQVVVDERLPGWFARAKSGHQLRPADEAERQALLAGLDALAPEGGP
jgi:hypothetical protein